VTGLAIITQLLSLDACTLAQAGGGEVKEVGEGGGGRYLSADLFPGDERGGVRAGTGREGVDGGGCGGGRGNGGGRGGGWGEVDAEYGCYVELDECQRAGHL
jgi:hypothetical protein